MEDEDMADKTFQGTMNWIDRNYEEFLILANRAWYGARYAIKERRREKQDLIARSTLMRRDDDPIPSDPSTEELVEEIAFIIWRGNFGHVRTRSTWDHTMGAENKEHYRRTARTVIAALPIRVL